VETARSRGGLSVVGQQRYARTEGMPRGLAVRYWRLLGAAGRVLDLGCGDGAFGAARPRENIEVHGVDADPRAVAAASRHERAVLLDLDAAPLPYPDGYFDAVLAKDIFEHVDDPGALARETHRVMRPGGAIVASVVMARPHRVWDDYTHRRGFTRRSARLLLEDAGFQVEALWRMGGVPLSSRLGFIDAVPALLRVPLLDALWGASWELKARR
jgi:SAM-dependent methyltransferase